MAHKPERVLIGKGLLHSHGDVAYAQARLLHLPSPSTGGCMATCRLRMVAATMPSNLSGALSAGMSQIYMISRAGLLEVQRFKGQYSSWFVGERVIAGLDVCCITHGVPLTPLYARLADTLLVRHRWGAASLYQRGPTAGPAATAGRF